MKLHFDHALVTRLLAHADAASEHTPTLDQLYDPACLRPGVKTRRPAYEDIDRTKIPAGLMLVGDQGIYLMSNGHPGLPGDNGEVNLVAYAREADTQASPEDWYDVKRASFGGDDGAEFLSAETIRKALEATARGHFWIDVSPTQIRCPFLAPPEEPRAGPSGTKGKGPSRQEKKGKV
ncbi:hypothetical protein CFR75_12275 [Komagataeibacter xylinus]|uniref:DUF3085 domain-containing protein n=1 Tax=Komagataeibacter xylinus TaxID=28448 RepID=A0A318Q007_KOMXY|nr:DUF3085 domain-containing protein [Komagataeibacter xylinus]PYD56197.1 hypothetical protein CFR75_12275 [Komagataeibacter xylinus]GBQ67973.1 hypothetical protein AA15237_0285 [Komagataeibacter xylinus NBRC 15237]